ncbi:MAG: ATP-binding protein [Trueperaceae bacterium]
MGAGVVVGVSFSGLTGASDRQMTGVPMHDLQEETAVSRPGSEDALFERHLRMVRVLLLALLAVLLLIIGLNLALLGTDGLSRSGTGLLLVGMSILVLLALARVRVRRLGQAVGLVVFGTLALLALETAEAGISASTTFLFAYTVPIAFAGLLVGRLALVGTALASVGIVVGVHLLERAGSGLVATDPDVGSPATVVIVFVLIVGLLSLVLERFGVELRNAHQAALRRQSELARLVAVLEREIEERKQAEVARDRSEERLSITSEAVGIGTWSWDLETGELVWSDSMKDLLGVPRDVVPSLELFIELVHPEDRPVLAEMSASPDESVETSEMTYRLLRRDGGVAWVAARYRTFPGEDGRGQQVGAMYEITDRMEAARERESLLERERSARAAAESSGAKLAFLAEASHLLGSSLDFAETLSRLGGLMVPRWADWCAVDILDADGNAQRLSVTHQDSSKVEAAHEIQRRYPSQPDRPGTAATLASGVTQYLPDISDADLQGVAQDGEHLRRLRELGFSSLVVVPLNLRGRTLGALSLVTAESGKRYTQEDVLFFEELAGRAAVAVAHARLFAEVRELNQELERRVEQRTSELSDALGELETFAYSVSHDLRAPLRGIDGFSQALLEDYAGRLDDEAVQYLDRIRGGARRMGELIDDLLNLSRLSQGELNEEQVDLGALAAEIVAGLRAEQPDRDVTVEIAPELHARGDYRLLRIALENIIGNAWKFTALAQQPRIEVGATNENGSTVYFVRDNGTGFDMSYVDKLFAPFQRLHSPQKFEGTGIGLATAQRVLRRHGGRIWAESVVDDGATFYFTIGT